MMSLTSISQRQLPDICLCQVKTKKNIHRSVLVNDDAVNKCFCHFICQHILILISITGGFEFRVDAILYIGTTLRLGLCLSSQSIFRHCIPRIKSVFVIPI